jgi:hypothetical protein
MRQTYGWDDGGRTEPRGVRSGDVTPTLVEGICASFNARVGQDPSSVGTNPEAFHFPAIPHTIPAGLLGPRGFPHVAMGHLKFASNAR